MHAHAGRDEAEALRLLVGADPKLDDMPARRVALLARLELDHRALLRAVLHPHREVGEPREDRVLLLDHHLHLLCMRSGGGVSGWQRCDTGGMEEKKYVSQTLNITTKPSAGHTTTNEVCTDTAKGERVREEGLGWTGGTNGRWIRTCDAHLQNLPSIHQLVQLHRLQQPRLLQVLAVLQLVALEEAPVRRERLYALVEADLRLLRPLGRFCIPIPRQQL